MKMTPEMKQHMGNKLIDIVMARHGISRKEACNLLNKTARCISKTVDLGVDPGEMIVEMLGLAPKNWIIELFL